MFQLLKDDSQQVSVHATFVPESQFSKYFITLVTIYDQHVGIVNGYPYHSVLEILNHIRHNFDVTLFCDWGSQKRIFFYCNKCGYEYTILNSLGTNKQLVHENPN